MGTRLFRLVSILAAIVLLALTSAPALADKITTIGGITHEGVIVRENNSYIVIKVNSDGEEVTKVFFLTEIKSIERGPAEPIADALRAKAIPPEATRIAFITLGDQRDRKDIIGPFVNDDALRESIQLLDALPDVEKPEIVVLWIDSGGGLLVETEKLINTIHADMKPKYRTVVWVRSAISAACMVSMVSEEIYMMTNAPIGAMTLIQQVDRVSRLGKHNPLIARAMSRCAPDFDRNDLTADIDEHGNVTLFDGPQGEHMVCKKTDILVFTAIDAVKFGLARGIADTKNELATLLGCKEWIEVGHGANDFQARFREQVKLAEQQVGELQQKLNIALQFAHAAENDPERNAQLARALNFLRDMRAIVRRAPSLEFYEGYTKQAFDDREEQIKDMRAR
ncbi:MAG: hypothetical protein R3B46_07155 [Phycisphaerales bacterium]|nr:hypothetical protein [Phycisphaerales bacterium]